MHELGEHYQRELRLMLVRMSCMEHDFIVRGRGGVQSLSAGLLEDPGSLGALGQVVGGAGGLGLATGPGLFGSLGGGGGMGRDDDEAAGVAAAVAAVEAATAAEREASVAAAAAAAAGGASASASAATAGGTGTREVRIERERGKERG